jgi:SAM-dependent methyltransferase
MYVGLNALGDCRRIEYDFERAAERAAARRRSSPPPEALPFQNGSFDLVLSHEVLEHVQDDRQAALEMVRVLRSGGRAVIFVPNRGYPFETHGMYWRGRYHFGNIPLVNYLPHWARDRLAPHCESTPPRSAGLVSGLAVCTIHHTVIRYDNIIARWPQPGAFTPSLNRSGLCAPGLSDFFVVEKI